MELSHRQTPEVEPPNADCLRATNYYYYRSIFWRNLAQSVITTVANASHESMRFECFEMLRRLGKADGLHGGMAFCAVQYSHVRA